MTFLLASLVDVTIILGIGLAIAAALRRRSAAVRHAVLTTSIICAALAPALELVMPQLPVIRGFGSDVVQPTEARFGGDSPVTVAETVPAATTSWPAVSWPVVVGGAWVVATLITFAGLAVSLWRLRRLGASCAPVSGPWRTLADTVARECGVRRPVELLQSTDRRLLMTYGMFRPRIILPADAGEWSSDRQAVVLRHELAHIRRHDAGIQLASEVLRVMQPFNPLVWIACRQQRRESEYACDDAVLSAGVEPADYATHLVDIAKGSSGRHTIWATAPAIAEPSTLERRIVAMLQHQKNRQPVTRVGWACVAIVAVAVSLPLAAVGVAPERAVAPEIQVPAPPSPAGLNSPSASSLETPPVSTPSLPAPAPIAPAKKNTRAQQASLSGTVHDETGAVIPGASVSLTNSQTQEVSTAVSNASGAFQFGNLPSGQYVLVTQLNGFRKRQLSIDLSAGSSASLTVTLQVGALSEALTVACKAPSVLDLFFPTLSAQERAPRPIRVGGNIKAPRKTKDVRPVCPEGGVTDTVVVILEGHVGVDGFVAGLKSLSDADTVPARFTGSAMDAVQQWEFTPTLLNGVPVPVVFTVTVSFTGR